MNSKCLIALNLANEYLSPKKLAHSLRVVQYAMEDYDFFHPVGVDNEDIFIVALLHDIVEDTKCTFKDLEDKGLPKYLISWIKEITKEEDEEYLDYIKKIGSSVAILVKRADIKDHLLLTETLTDKLKDKYLPAISYLL